ncbi:MAG: type IX secretion system protein PorQ [Chitinophagales bacterium]|nr:type IX secretion system protein PorQ [Chitinophagales bacterium]
MKKIIGIFFVFLYYSISVAQVGGNAVFESLTLPATPRSASLGGTAIAVQTYDIGMGIDNPALIDSTVDKNIHFNTTFYPAGINFGALAYGFHTKKAGNFVAALRYVSYGKFDGYDASGTPTGTFKGGDYAFQVGTGRSYKKLIYGIDAKLLFSHLETYNAIALATDVSVGFHNETKKTTATLMVKNLGIQLKSYTSDQREKLPWDISLGFSKGLKKIPFTFNIVAHHLQKWDLTYDDPNQQEETNIFGEPIKKKSGFVDNLFRHFVFGTEIDIKKVVALRIGYNHLQRKELQFDAKKGLGGLSAGLGLHIKQFNIDYAYARYGIVASANHLGITVNLHQFGLKKTKSSALPE